MEFALDANSKRINIRDAKKKEQYFCPGCKTLMIPKQGNINVWHFAHKSRENCVDYYDNKGEWHRYMQNLFDDDQCEIFNDEFGKHIFDVLTKKNRIIEFQHSSISESLFWKRTNDYIAHSKLHNAKKPIWIFDYWDKDCIISRRPFPDWNSNRFEMKHPVKIFGDYNSKKSEFVLVFRVYPKIWIYDREIRNRRFKYPGTKYIVIKRYCADGNGYGNVYTKTQFEHFLSVLNTSDETKRKVCDNE